MYVLRLVLVELKALRKLGIREDLVLTHIQCRGNGRVQAISPCVVGKVRLVRLTFDRTRADVSVIN